MLDVNDLRNELKEYNYKMLTGGDDDVAVRALHKAEIWCRAKVIAVAGSFDPESQINREIVLKRALYELYAFADNEGVAHDKREDALELLRAAYGSGIESGGYQQGASDGGTQGSPLAAVVTSDRNRTMF